MLIPSKYFICYVPDPPLDPPDDPPGFERIFYNVNRLVVDTDHPDSDYASKASHFYRDRYFDVTLKIINRGDGCWIKFVDKKTGKVFFCKHSWLSIPKEFEDFFKPKLDKFIDQLGE